LFLSTIESHLKNISTDYIRGTTNLSIQENTIFPQSTTIDTNLNEFTVHILLFIAEQLFIQSRLNKVNVLIHVIRTNRKNINCVVYLGKVILV
jgi:hypothetical protein